MVKIRYLNEVKDFDKFQKKKNRNKKKEKEKKRNRKNR
jgi:hypothetical protein